MESLALLVSIILLVVVWLGPISLMLALVSQRWARVVGYITGGLGILAGLWLATTVDSPGARLIGLIAGLLGLGGVLLNWRKAKNS